MILMVVIINTLIKEIYPLYQSNFLILDANLNILTQNLTLKVSGFNDESQVTLNLINSVLKVNYSCKPNYQSYNQSIGLFYCKIIESNIVSHKNWLVNIMINGKIVTSTSNIVIYDPLKTINNFILIIFILVMLLGLIICFIVIHKNLIRTIGHFTSRSTKSSQSENPMDDGSNLKPFIDVTTFSLYGSPVLMVPVCSRRERRKSRLGLEKILTRTKSQPSTETASEPTFTLTNNRSSSANENEKRKSLSKSDNH